jgi:FixJ family two-component response regulator
MRPEPNHPEPNHPEPSKHAQPVIYLVDDDDAVREALQVLIGTVGLEVRAFDSPQAFNASFDPQVIGCVVMDVRMPGTSGLELQEHLKIRGVDLPIIIITGHGDVNLARRAFLGGAVELLTKPVDEQTLLESLQRAIREHIRTRERQGVTREARARLERLSPREREVLSRIVEGDSNKQIARLLGLSARTVETHRAHLFEKLQVQSLAELIRLYIRALEHPP